MAQVDWNIAAQNNITVNAARKRWARFKSKFQPPSNDGEKSPQSAKAEGVRKRKTTARATKAKRAKKDDSAAENGEDDKGSGEGESV